jgi:hypothetical protein
MYIIRSSMRRSGKSWPWLGRPCSRNNSPSCPPGHFGMLLPTAPAGGRGRKRPQRPQDAPPCRAGARHCQPGAAAHHAASSGGICARVRSIACRQARRLARPMTTRPSADSASSSAPSTPMAKASRVGITTTVTIVRIPSGGHMPSVGWINSIPFGDQHSPSHLQWRGKSS